MNKTFLSFLVISCSLQAAELSIENPPSEDVRTAALAQVKAKLEEEQNRLQQELDKIDYGIAALQGRHGCFACLKVWPKIFFSRKKITRQVI